MFVISEYKLKMMLTQLNIMFFLKEVEPLAKRTRRSIETRESKKETIVK